MEYMFNLDMYNFTKEEEILAKKLAPFIMDLIVAKQKYDFMLLNSLKVNKQIKEEIDITMGWKKG
jgi:hypothetical protein